MVNPNACGGKNRIDRKREELKIELNKPRELVNWFKVKRLKESIKRNKEISRIISRRRKRIKW